MAIEARGDIRYGDKGNMTRQEIDQTIAILIDLKKANHFRAFWSSFDESVNFMAAGEVVIQSMWPPMPPSANCYWTLPQAKQESPQTRGRFGQLRSSPPKGQSLTRTRHHLPKLGLPNAI